MATANAFDQFDAAGNPFDAFDQRRKDAPESPVAASDSLAGRIKAALQTPSPEWLQPFETAVKHNVEPFIQHPIDSVYKTVVPQKEDFEAIKQVFTDPQKAFSRDTPIGSQQWWDQVVGYGAPLVLGAAGKGFSPKTAAIRTALAEDAPRGASPAESGVLNDLRSETARISPEVTPAVEEVPEFARKPLEQPDSLHEQPVANPNDFRPALKTDEGVISGEQGQTHEDIYNAQPDPPELRASDPEHGFVDSEGNFKTREEVSQALGEEQPMQSERLAELRDASNPRTTGIANRVLKAEAEAGKIGEVESGEGISWQDSVQRGRDLLNGGADPQMVARRVQRSGRISADDMAVLRAERERMNLETNRAEDAFRRSPNDVTRKAWQDARAAETKFVREAVQPAKTEWHKLGMATQGEAPIDYSTFAGLRKAAVDEKLRDVTPPEEKALQRAAKNVRDATGKEVEASQRLARQAARQFRGQKIKTVEELKAEASKMMQELMPCK